MRSVALIAGTGSRELLRGLVREDVRVNIDGTAVALVLVHHPPFGFYYLHRHGPGHCVAPHLINHDAHFAALRALGVKRVVALSAVGSLRPDLEAGSAALPHDFIVGREATDRTSARPERLAPVHTDFSHPYCAALQRELRAALTGHPGFVDGVTYMGVPGPRYETPAEVALFARQGADVVGMTGTAEAVSAREAGICYAAIACVTNLGSGLAPQGVRHGAVATEMQAIVAGLRDPLLRALGLINDLPPCAACGSRGH